MALRMVQRAGGRVVHGLSSCSRIVVVPGQACQVPVQVDQVQVRGIKVEDFDEEDYKKRVHPETPRYPNEYSLDPPNGKIYDKKPFKMMLEADKKYFWCTCGTSKRQPVCDGNHKKLRGTSLKKINPNFMPLKFTVEETKEYWLCNCKQTSNRPYCDGTHKREDIQAAVK